ncbi:hypothetical protein BHM03_00052345 [Ensete ventricosum]|nr:hypothetical protein BHM03_00052345 [Ensete ventricosum]
MPRVRPRPLASGPTWLVLDAPQRRQQKRRSMQSNEESKSRLTPRGRSELLLRLQEGKEVASLLRWLPIPLCPPLTALVTEGPPARTSRKTENKVERALQIAVSVLADSLWRLQSFLECSAFVSGSQAFGPSEIATMAMEAPLKVALGTLAFVVFWILAVFPAVPCLPIGRTAGSLLGALLMVIFRVISPEEAYSAIDLPILGLLFGTMVVSVFLEKADMFKYLGHVLSWKSRGGKDLLLRICLVSAIASALFTNDTCCVVLTEFILNIARKNNLPPKPFLLALASSSNIGSAATPIGNPQNLLIALQSGMSFVEFLSGIVVAMLVGVLVNAAILLCYFWRLLSAEKDEDVGSAAAVATAEVDVNLHRFSPATMSHLDVKNSQAPASDASAQSSVSGAANLRCRTSSGDGGVTDSAMAPNPSRGGICESGDDGASTRTKREDEHEECAESTGWRTQLWKTCVYLVTTGMLISLSLGLNMSWTAITAALALVVLDFRDALPCLEKVTMHIYIDRCELLSEGLALLGEVLIAAALVAASGFVFLVDILQRDVHNGEWLQQDRHTECVVGVRGTIRTD